MRTELTSTEAAKAVGVSPSTFRAYVSRKQAPQPRRKAGGVNLWSVFDLAAWRELGISDDETRSIRADVSRKYSRGRFWEESTRRALAQVGLDHRSAQSLIDGITTGGMDVQTYRDARTILDIRRDFKRRIAAATDEPADAIEEDSLLRQAAERVSAGTDVFAVLADLAFDLTSQGLPELMPPLRFDGQFWNSQNDTAAFLAYLRRMDRVDVPEVV